MTSAQPLPDEHAAYPIVKLTLINVSSHFDQSDDVEPLLNKALDIGCACLTNDETITRSASTSPSTNEKQGAKNCTSCAAGTDNIARERISKAVMRFVKPQDRYLALGSVLLKSRAYHQTLSEENEGRPESSTREGTTSSQSSLTLVELPRTKYGKPYISLVDKIDNCEVDDNGSSPSAVQHTISVSHQFPYVGIARLPACSQMRSLHVGLDIAMYEAPNPKLYATSSEFLQVFKDSFTPTEWGCIVDSSAAWFGRRRKSDEDSRREFYMRWAAKEAYTKALGLGLGHEFGSFEIAFDCFENDDDGIGGLADALDALGSIKGSDAEGRDKQIVAKRMTTWGEIRYAEKEDVAAKDEIWHFTLLELKHLQQGSSADIDTAGCACVCVGPLEKNRDESDIGAIVQEEMVSLEDALQWHEHK